MAASLSLPSHRPSHARSWSTRVPRFKGSALLLAAIVIGITTNSPPLGFFGLKKKEEKQKQEQQEQQQPDLDKNTREQGNAQGDPWYGEENVEVGQVISVGKETPAYDTVVISMRSLPFGRIGVNIAKGRRLISRVVHADAFNAGWRPGDQLMEVDGKAVEGYWELRRAVEKAIAEHEKTGRRLQFTVRRWGVKGTTTTMVRLAPPSGEMGHLVPPLDLTKGLLKDYPVVLFLEGNLAKQSRSSSRRAVEVLKSLNVAFKALDCTNQKVNPGIMQALEDLGVPEGLPQLFAGGHRLDEGWTENSTEELSGRLRDAGAFFVERRARLADQQPQRAGEKSL